GITDYPKNRRPQTKNHSAGSWFAGRRRLGIRRPDHPHPRPRGPPVGLITSQTCYNKVDMTTYPEAAKIKAAIEAASHIAIVQADNPDADSLASALALEEILGEMGKQVTLYCGVDTPSYLNYLSGSSRVTNDLPKQFDLSIILDTSSD